MTPTGGPGPDILGIELGRHSVRGACLDPNRAVVTALAEVPIADGAGTSVDGVLRMATVAPAVEELLSVLAVGDRSQLRVGFTIGPRNAGVGSGPAMTSWLESQAVALQESMQCSGGLGIAFVPCRAVDEALKLARETGVELARVDLAPVAAARAIGDQVDDRMLVGSGHGWQSRMRDLEVLEAMECDSVADDAPLCLVSGDGATRPIDGYGWVEPASELVAQGVDFGLMATAVGAAIGVAYDSPANLLLGKVVPSGAGESALAPNLARLAEVNVAPDAAESTLRLNNPQPESGVVDEGRREPRDTPQTSLSPIRRTTAAFAQPAPEGHRPELPARPGSARTATMEPVAAELVEDEAIAESDPINLFSPDTEVQDMMGTRDRRIAVDVTVALIVLAALVALVVLYAL